MFNLPKKPLHIGIVGAGWIVKQFYLPYLQNKANIEKIVIYDNLPFTFNNMHKIVVVSSVKKILQDKNITVVIIAVPNKFHYAFTQRALLANKHVICEKPLCINQRESQKLKKLISLKRKTNLLLPALPCRFRQDIHILKKILKNNSIGKIYKFNAKWIRKDGIPSSDWFLNKKNSGGGVLMDLGSHLLDIILWLTVAQHLNETHCLLNTNFIHNKAKISTWRTGAPLSSVDKNVEDNVTALLKFDHVSGFLDLSWASSYYRDEVVIELFGAKGYIKLTTIFGFSTHTDIKYATIDIFTNTTHTIKKIKVTDRFLPYQKMMDTYLAHIEKHETKITLATETLAVINLIDHLYHHPENKPLLRRMHHASL